MEKQFGWYWARPSSINDDDFDFFLLVPLFGHQISIQLRALNNKSQLLLINDFVLRINGFCTVEVINCTLYLVVIDPMPMFVLE